jgi:O-antigen/teichoic acid export membrane protein
LIFVGLFVAAPIVPIVLGKDYARAVEALRWLALLPLFKSIHYFLADSLTGAGYQRIRTAGQIGVAVFNVALNLWLIPAYSWRGAAWSSLASDGALALTMYVAVMYIMSREARSGVGFAGERLTSNPVE